MNTTAFTMEKPKKVVENFKNNKIPGENLISGEMCKAMGENGIGRLHSLINDICSSENIPADLWTT